MKREFPGFPGGSENLPTSAGDSVSYAQVLVPVCLISSLSGSLWDFPYFTMNAALYKKELEEIFNLTVFCCCSVAQSCLTYDPMNCSPPGFLVLHHFPELAQTHIHQIGDAIQPSHPLSSPSPPAFNLSQHQGLFQWVSSSHQMAKVLEFSFSISPSNEYSGLISFKVDWFDFLAVQETLKGLLQHLRSKTSIL